MRESADEVQVIGSMDAEGKFKRADNGEEPGVGLAAPQIGLPLALAVVEDAGVPDERVAVNTDISKGIFDRFRSLAFWRLNQEAFTLSVNDTHPRRTKNSETGRICPNHFQILLMFICPFICYFHFVGYVPRF